jgi:hypothetical protein
MGNLEGAQQAFVEELVGGQPSDVFAVQLDLA